jgi:poly(beta-D-mannuronate) C5 epimerase
MKVRRPRVLAGAVVAVLVAGWIVDTAATPALAAACSGQVRYAASTNTIYLQSGTASLSDIKSSCPSAPLALADPAARVWQLDADLVIQNGATLNLHGSAAGGDVDTLRLRSGANTDKTQVSAITAQYGTVDIDTVLVTSWDPEANGPDTDPSVPAGAPPGARGRSFVRAISYLDAGGTPRESTMNIANSDLGYLGYYAAESYGVAYKGRGCDHDHQSVCDALNVYGSQTNSRFHHNYMGTYTWNAYGMTFTGNEYDNNISYGLDPHDDSDYLTITDNRSHDNGNHGIICSKRCDHLVIARNEVYRNGIPPYVPPGDEDASDNQVHGIMIHRGVTDTMIEDNYVHDHPNGAGIAVFDSVGNTIRDNLIVGAKYGLRYSVGAADVMTTGNTVRDSEKYAVFTYRGSDLPTYSTPSGRPTGLTFSNNTFDGTASNVIKMNEADSMTFSGNTFTGTLGSARMQNSTDTAFTGNTAPSSLLFATYGSPSQPGRTRFAGVTAPTRVSVDGDSTASFTNTDGTVYDLGGPAVPTSLTPSGGTLTLTSAQVGTSSVTVTPRPVQVVPSAGTATAQLTGWGASAFDVYAAVGTAGTDLSFTIGGLAPGAWYTIIADGSPHATVQADSSGTITFSATPSGTSEVDYRVAAA